MPKLEAKDGGHTAFTDHKIQRRRELAPEPPQDVDIAAWREPAAALRERNLGIALIEVGMDRHSAKSIVQGYRLLTAVQKQFSGDSALYTWMGNALLLGKQFSEAQQAFELALQLDPGSATKETDLGQAYAAAGDLNTAALHLEGALKMDPLDLPAADTLLDIYNKQGNAAKAEALSERLRQAMK